MPRAIRPAVRPAVRSTIPLALAASLALGAAPVRAQETSAPFAAEASNALDWLTLAGTQLGLVALRLFADVEYGDVEALPGTGAVLVSDIVAAIPLPYAAPRACTVTIGSYEGRQSMLALLTGILGDQSARMTDVAVPLACLPPPARTTAQVAGLTEIAIDEVRVSTAYDLPTAEANVSLSLSVRDVADVELRAMLDYAFVRFDFTRDGGADERQDPFAEDDGPTPVPAIEFGPVDLTIADRGLTDRALPFLRLAGITPDQVPAIVGDGVRSALGPVPLAEDLERELARFLSEGGRLAVALRPGTLWLDEIEDASPPEIIEAFNPSVGAGTRPDVLDPGTLTAIAGGTLADDRRVEVARAFLDGTGLPRNPERALATLEPVLESDADAQALAAEAILDAGGPADRAYGLALRAGAGGADAVTVLRRAEARVTPAQAAEGQRIAFGNWDGAPAYEAALDDAVAAGDTLTILRTARAYATGLGAVRSYERALGYALLADAAGEVGARALAERIEARLTADADARAAWAPVIAAARAEATDRWLEGGLGLALAERDAGPNDGAARAE